MQITRGTTAIISIQFFCVVETELMDFFLVKKPHNSICANTLWI